MFLLFCNVCGSYVFGLVLDIKLVNLLFPVWSCQINSTLDLGRVFQRNDSPDPHSILTWARETVSLYKVTSSLQKYKCHTEKYHVSGCFGANSSHTFGLCVLLIWADLWFPFNLFQELSDILKAEQEVYSQPTTRFPQTQPSPKLCFVYVYILLPKFLNLHSRQNPRLLQMSAFCYIYIFKKRKSMNRKEQPHLTPILADSNQVIMLLYKSIIQKVQVLGISFSQ